MLLFLFFVSVDLISVPAILECATTPEIHCSLPDVATTTFTLPASVQDNATSATLELGFAVSPYQGALLDTAARRVDRLLRVHFCVGGRSAQRELFVACTRFVNDGSTQRLALDVVWRSQSALWSAPLPASAAAASLIILRDALCFRLPPHAFVGELASALYCQSLLASPGNAIVYNAAPYGELRSANGQALCSITDSSLHCGSIEADFINPNALSPLAHGLRPILLPSFGDSFLAQSAASLALVEPNRLCFTTSSRTQGSFKYCVRLDRAPPSFSPAPCVANCDVRDVVCTSTTVANVHRIECGDSLFTSFSAPTLRMQISVTSYVDRAGVTRSSNVIDVRYGNDLLCVVVALDNMSSFGCTPLSLLNDTTRVWSPNDATPFAFDGQARFVADDLGDAVCVGNTWSLRCRSLLYDNAPFIALPTTLATFDPLRSFEDGDMIGAASRSPLVSLWFPFRNITVTPQSQPIPLTAVHAVKQPQAPCSALLQCASCLQVSLCAWCATARLCSPRRFGSISPPCVVDGRLDLLDRCAAPSPSSTSSARSTTTTQSTRNDTVSSSDKGRSFASTKATMTTTTTTMLATTPTPSVDASATNSTRIVRVPWAVVVISVICFLAVVVGVAVGVRRYLLWRRRIEYV